MFGVLRAVKDVSPGKVPACQQYRQYVIQLYVIKVISTMPVDLLWEVIRNTFNIHMSGVVCFLIRLNYVGVSGKVLFVNIFI